MNTGKTLFAQLMDFLPWTTFTRIVDRYGGDHRVRTLSCAEQYRSMAFAQLTYREKPARHRDLPLGPRIETLSHGLPPAGPALDAGRCQRKARLAYPCGVGPAAHHPGEDAVRRRRTGVGPDQYRLRPGLDDHRSVPVGLSVGALPHHQGGGEDAHAARPAGQHSEFYPHLGWQAARRSCLDMLLPEAGAIYVVDRGYVDFARLYVLHQRRMVERRIKAAHFPVVKSLDSFDFKVIPSLNKALVLELARCAYIERRENLIALGNSGTGKTHIALGLGLAACQKGLSVGFITAAALVHELIEAAMTSSC